MVRFPVADEPLFNIYNNPLLVKTSYTPCRFFTIVIHTYNLILTH